VHTKLPKDVANLIKKEAKKNVTKKGAVKKARKSTNLAQTTPS
jgi:hypothetical protein